MSEYMEYLDPHGAGVVQYSDFLPVIAKRLQTRESVDDLMRAFRVFDKEHKGTVTPEELRHILTHFGEVRAPRLAAACCTHEEHVIRG